MKKIASKQERYDRIKKGVGAAKKGTFSSRTVKMSAKGKKEMTAAQDRVDQEKKLGVKRGKAK